MTTDRRGNQTGAIAYAREALSVADETEPAIPRHPTLGQPDVLPELRAELRALVQAQLQRHDGSARCLLKHPGRADQTSHHPSAINTQGLLLGRPDH